MTYDSEVLADSPWAYYSTTEASGTITDDSGNGRNLALPGGSPTYAQPGPVGANDALLFPDSAGATEYYATVSTSAITGQPLTLECWINYSGTPPTNPTPLIGLNFGYGNNSRRPIELVLGTDGKVKLLTGTSTSSSTLISAASALSAGWHHVVAAVGTAGAGAQKIRVDKVEVATGTAATSFVTGSTFMIHGGGSDASAVVGDLRNGGALTISKVALYTTQLSDARIDAHFDAMVPPTISGTLSATLPKVTASFAGTYRDVGTLSAVLPKVTASLTGTYQAPPTGTLAATLPKVTASFVGTYTDPPTPSGTLSAVLPKVTASFTGAYIPRETGTLSAVLPRATADFAGDYAPPPYPVGILAAVLPLPVVAFSGTYTGPIPTDTSNAFNGLSLVGTGSVSYSIVSAPPAYAAPAGVDIAVAHPVPVLDKGQVTNWKLDRAVSKAGCVDQVIVNGKDITWFRADQPGDDPTATPGYQLVEPFGYGASQPLLIPRTNASLEVYGQGDLKWLKPGAKVQYRRIKPDSGIVTDYRGVIDSIGTDSSGVFACEISGEVLGKASNVHKPRVLSRDLLDLGSQVSYAMRGMGFSISPRFPVTGILFPNEGDTMMSSHLTKLGALSQTSESPQRVIMPIGEWGGKVYGFNPQDLTTVDLTAYAGDPRVQLDLRDDMTEQPNTIYGSGITPGGERWNGSVYPDLIQGPAPAYPMAGGASFGIGTTNAETVNGDGIEILRAKLAVTNFLGDRYTGLDPYDSRVAEAVNRVKEEAGIVFLDGEMDTETWAALYSLEVAGYSTESAKVLPLAQTKDVRVYDRAANGAILRRNPDHVPGSRRVDRVIDYGVCEPDQAARHAKSLIYGTAGHQFSGSITLTGVGAFLGEHDGTDWDTLTSSDLLPARSIRPGMNVWLPYFDGGTLLHIAGVDVTPVAGTSPATVRLMVSTSGLSMFDLSEALKRNQESKRSPYREKVVAHLGIKPSGNLITRDRWFGKVFDARPLIGGQWNVFPVVMGQSGTVGRVDIRTTATAAEFCGFVSAKPVTEARLNAIAGDPFSYDDDGLTIFEKEWAQPFFDDRLMLYVNGQGLQPGGYGWRKGYDSNTGERTPNPLTGQLLDDASWSYLTDPKKAIVWVAIYPDRDCTLKRGRLFYALEDDVT